MTAELSQQIAELREMMLEIRDLLSAPKESRGHYTVEEVASRLGKSSFTVREWCRHGRINATKRAERRGGAELWSISATEVTRIKDEGLLPQDPFRNQRN